MSNLNIVIIGPEDFGKEIGKKGTSTDITFYNLKKGEATLTLIEPSRYPEKLSSLFYAVSLADVAVVVIDKVTAQLGECILELNCAHLSRGYLILRNYLDAAQISPLIKGTVLEQYKVLPDDLNVLRETLLDDAAALPAIKTDSPGIIPIDHHFNVKGIGTVILGCVQDGTVHKHDQVTIHPLGKSIQIRSIQKHDDDVNEAHAGDRVGLALKGIESDDLDRGYVLTASSGIQSKCEITGTAKIIQYWPEPLKEQMVLYAGHWMQFLPCRVQKVAAGGDWRSAEITLSFEKELIFKSGSVIILHYLEGEKLRIVGTLELA
ncbi:EF-Tu/IF-2/RF-3 family GTPase [Methanospirillum lacunae]|uniref:Elongation factor Tu n=1 Tax=Methanospirillum lacunae TaxID=668570 RepID=A0A2V2MUH8_9EURY|nr:EF-Tu/IF-2/RF-3 family GTPase [Methanospirillum lacunae]PWR69960.1 elongation factor Tu [Methanospirillum lacunae]